MGNTGGGDAATGLQEADHCTRYVVEVGEEKDGKKPRYVGLHFTLASKDTDPPTSRLRDAIMWDRRRQAQAAVRNYRQWYSGHHFTIRSLHCVVGEPYMVLVS